MASTSRYRFEFRLLEWAESFSRRLNGGRRAFFLGMRADGSVRRIYFARQDEGFDGDMKNRLAEQNAVWFLYNPYDEGGAGYLEWFELPRDTAERWLDRTLQTEDFIDVRASGVRDSWPLSWRVIVS